MILTSRNSLLRALAIAGLVALLILPWWRNHALLVDFYDYGLVMSAAGRMQLGERPYVDFISPIQTLQFLAATLGERLWGARYLSLTYTSLAFILGSFVGFASLLWRPLGGGLALLIAAAVVAATSCQHTIIWYNAMGVTWLAVVVWLTARPAPPDQLGEFARLGLVWSILWLGGMTKLTFQVAELAFAIAFTLRSAVADELAWSAARFRILSFVSLGVFAPILTEMMVTGARLDQWLENVVVLPAQYRAGMLSLIGTWQFYLHTPHDYYHPLFFTFAGAWGVVLLALAIALIAARLWTQPRLGRAIDWAMLAVLGAGALVTMAVLLATNMDIAYVSAAVPLVLAVGLARAFSIFEEGNGRAWMRGLLTSGALSLLVPAWLAAWTGTRALWGHEPLVRARMVSADDLPPRYAYLRGMKIPPTLHAELVAFEQTVKELSASGVSPNELYFTNGTEWFTRAISEARHSGLPLWLAKNTTYSDAGTWTLARKIEDDPRIRAIISYGGWNDWSGGLQSMLKEKFIHQMVGPLIHLYQRRELPDPLEFAVNTHSNLYVKQFTVTGGPVDLDVMTNRLFYYGGRDPHRIDFGFGLYRLEGELVGEMLPSRTEPVAAKFRIFAREGGRLTDKLWDETIELGPETRALTRHFSISPGGRPVSLILYTKAEAPAHFGWRSLYTEQSADLTGLDPWPMNSRLNRRTFDTAAMNALFGVSARQVRAANAYGDELHVRSVDGVPELHSGAPDEIWFKLEGPAVHLAGEFQLTDALAKSTGGVRIVVVIYKSGRFDIRYDRSLRPTENPADRVPQTFETWLPEGRGWVGLIVTPLDGQTVPADAVAWRKLRMW